MVSCTRETLVYLPHVSNPVPEAFDDRWRLVGRTIVNDDAFHRRVGLIEDAVDRESEEGSPVVRRDDDTDERPV